MRPIDIFMHRTVISWVIYGGRHCRRMNEFDLPKNMSPGGANYPRSNKTQVSDSSISHVFCCLQYYMDFK